jgi:hypothetical protein
MRFLEFPGRLNGRSVPLPIRFSREGTVFRERLLNLGNAVGSGSLLPPLPPARFPRFSFPVRRAPRFGRSGLVRRRALRFRRTRKHTQSRRKKQRQGRVGRFSESHSEWCWVWLSRYRRRYCWPSAGTLPDKYSVRIRSLSCRRSTLNTTSSPFFSFVTVLR